MEQSPSISTVRSIQKGWRRCNGSSTLPRPGHISTWTRPSSLGRRYRGQCSQQSSPDTRPAGAHGPSASLDANHLPCQSPCALGCMPLPLRYSHRTEGPFGTRSQPPPTLPTGFLLPCSRGAQHRVTFPHSSPATSHARPHGCSPSSSAVQPSNSVQRGLVSARSQRRGSTIATGPSCCITGNVTGPHKPCCLLPSGLSRTNHSSIANHRMGQEEEQPGPDVYLQLGSRQHSRSSLPRPVPTPGTPPASPSSLGNTKVLCSAHNKAALACGRRQWRRGAPTAKSFWRAGCSPRPSDASLCLEQEQGERIRLHPLRPISQPLCPKHNPLRAPGQARHNRATARLEYSNNQGNRPEARGHAVRGQQVPTALPLHRAHPTTGPHQRRSRLSRSSTGSWKRAECNGPGLLH
ncbi:uncharacterized protein LOC132244601 [Alligator mississippiensis]|uniref:uncharacterized protein LOC132244601 n=1 Tax=Alligator mississippiensis TaxID=8496 RepID=UPI00287777E1|nr:uncharacterized protein LOC132244601 [Alligator mississippiensis]